DGRRGTGDGRREREVPVLRLPSSVFRLRSPVPGPQSKKQFLQAGEVAFPAGEPGGLGGRAGGAPGRARGNRGGGAAGLAPGGRETERAVGRQRSVPRRRRADHGPPLLRQPHAGAALPGRGSPRTALPRAPAAEYAPARGTASRPRWAVRRWSRDG